VVFISSVQPAHSAEPPLEGGAKSAKTLGTVAASPPASEKVSSDTPRKKAQRLRFQFRYQPWKDVLDWFAQQADLSLVMDAPPSGTFNYSDTREYTPAEAIDLLNSVLLTKGYTLVRRDRMLMLVNIEDGIPKNLVSTVPVESLDGKGESELVNVHFTLTKVRPEDIEADVQKLLGPQGSVVALAKSQQLSVTDTVERLRAVHAYLKSIEGPEGTVSSGLKTFHLKYARPDDVLPIVRQLLEIPEDKNAAADGSIRIAQEAGNDRLLVSGRPDKVARASEIIEKLDVPTPGAAGPGQRGHVRTLPMSEGAARAALQRVEEVWPSMRPNQIRIVSPAAEPKQSGNITTERDEYNGNVATERDEYKRDDAGPSSVPKRAPSPREQRPANPPSSLPPRPQEAPQAAPLPKVTTTASERPGTLFSARILWVADPVPAKAPADAKSPPPIIVIVGPHGVTITSEDLEALDEFERLLATASSGAGTGPMAVFYLKHAKAQEVAETLDKILSGGTAAAEASTEKASDAARPAASRKALATGPIKITPEPRLNALLVLANRADQDTVEQLLKVLDLKESPEDVAVSPKPRMIAVEHARAKDIAEVLRQVYADRLIVAQPQGQQGRGGGFLPLLMRGMAGGFGGGQDGGGGGFNGGGFNGGGFGGGRGQYRRDEANRISIGVDTRTNTLVVAATDPLFEEVKQLVQQLDVAAASQNETVRVVTLHRTSAVAVQKALEAFAGDAVQSNNPTTTAPAANAGANATPAPSAPPWWASRGFGRQSDGSPAGQPSMGNGGPLGGNPSPLQGFGGRRQLRNSQSGGPAE